MSTPEPSDVGPIAGGHLPATAADQQLVIDLLDGAVAEGRLLPQEYDERARAARAAATFDDLAPLTRDLVPATPVTPTTWPAPGTAVAETADADSSDLILTVFGGTSRRGRWRAKRRIGVLNLFGGTDLDFRDAAMDAPASVVNVFCLFGGVDVTVPDGYQVENNVVAVFGGSGMKVSPPQPGAPTVVVRGFVGFGGVDVKTPKPKKKPELR